jgi:hypothetical protein
LLAVSAVSAAAQGTTIAPRSAGLGGDVRAIDLAPAGLVDGAAITNQLEGSQGVVFSGAYFVSSNGVLRDFNPFAGYGAAALLNGTNTDFSTSITLRFTRPVQAVAFNLFATQFDPQFFGPGQSETQPRLAAYRDGVETASLSTSLVQRGPVPGVEPLWWVFEGDLISSITITAPVFSSPGQLDFVHPLAIANLQVLDILPLATVPEPGTLLLLAVGGSVLAASRRRRR